MHIQNEAEQIWTQATIRRKVRKKGVELQLLDIEICDNMPPDIQYRNECMDNKTFASALPPKNLQVSKAMSTTVILYSIDARGKTA